MILYDYDSNAIWAQPFKTRSAENLLAAYQLLHAWLCSAGLKPKLQRLDNECSKSLKVFMSQEEIDFQLVPPQCHHRNAAERCIRTFANHFIAGLCSTDKDFPLHLWDKLVPQAELTLNLLRGSRINPRLSAWAQTHGNFDFNRTPLAPPGLWILAYDSPCRVQIKSGTQRSMDGQSTTTVATLPSKSLNNKDSNDSYTTTTDPITSLMRIVCCRLQPHDRFVRSNMQNQVCDIRCDLTSAVKFICTLQLPSSHS
jgi:hypothetical protein